MDLDLCLYLSDSFHKDNHYIVRFVYQSNVVFEEEKSQDKVREHGWYDQADMITSWSKCHILMHISVSLACAFEDMGLSTKG